MPFNPPLTQNEQIYKYRLLNRIDGGSFGEIWLARDESIARDVAIKILDASQASINQHLLEAQIGNRMEHANLVKIHYADVVERQGVQVAVIVMDYLRNGSVINALNPANFLPIKVTLPILIDVLRGLEFLHEQDMYHNDIKPKNILVGDGNEGILTDYGISAPGAGQTYVTPRGAYRLHMAPEVINNRHINAQTDIYQLGLTMFRLLNGIGRLRDKYQSIGEDAYNRMVQNGNVVKASDYLPFIPQNLRTIIGKAIHVDPARRYQSALEMRRKLEGLSYSGNWTCVADGSFLGECRTNFYRFEEVSIGRNVYSFNAFKRNKASGNETRIGDFCKPRIDGAATQQLRKRFIHAACGNGGIDVSDGIS